MKVKVECHSGYAYPERPAAVQFDDRRFEILEVTSEWRTPRGKHFQVRLSDKREIELVFDEELNDWQAVETV